LLATKKPGLIAETVEAQLLVFDPETNEAHALNEGAALVYELCDGETTTEEMRLRLPEIGLPPDREIVELALAELREASLIDVAPELPATGVTRRTLTRRLGLSAVGVALIPVVDTVLAAPAYAQSSVGTTSGSTGSGSSTTASSSLSS
jgi:coenzyme PQQ synthesis protein D (PqqD)